MVEPLRAVILAAGKGERLVSGKAYPKPLAPVSGVPLIVRVIHTLARAGVTDVGVIHGYLGEVLVDALAGAELPVTLRFFENAEYDKPNGTSLLKAAAFVTGPTFVLMSDHLFAPSLLTRVRAFALAEDEAVLGIDYDVPRCFDLPDATKVKVDGDRIVRIGKELDDYDALDTGVFRITPGLVHELERVNGAAGCSLSQGVGALASRGKMRVVSVGDARWIDVDTPEAHAEAERLLGRHGDTLDG